MNSFENFHVEEKYDTFTIPFCAEKYSAQDIPYNTL